MASRVVSGFVIEAGIPIPRVGAGRPRHGVSEAIRQMQVGESIVVKDWSESVRAHAHTTAERMGIKLKTRVTVDGMRIWKVEDCGEQKKQVSKKAGKKASPSPAEPMAKPVPAAPAKPIEPEKAVSLCAAAGIKTARFNPSLIEWKMRGVTESELQQALAAGAKSIDALDQVFKSAHA